MLWTDYDSYDIDLLKPSKNKGHWKTKDGTNLLIKDMSTKHIKNTINLLKKKSNMLDECDRAVYEDYYKFKINELYKELEDRKMEMIKHD